MIPRDRRMPSRLYLARRGQTVWDAEHRLHGQLDSPLSDEGIAQAHAMARRLTGTGVTTVFSSPLGRALRTAVIVADALGAEIVEVPELAEVHHGAMAGLTRAEITEQFPGAREARAENRYGWAFPGGESYAQARVRARAALSTCGWRTDDPPLLVSHEMIGRMIRAEMRRLSPTQALALRQPHGMVLELRDGEERAL